MIAFSALVLSLSIVARPPLTDHFTAENAESAEDGFYDLNGSRVDGPGGDGGAVVGAVPGWAQAGGDGEEGQVQVPERGSHLRVWLLTIGQGNYIWERFGHNAIRVLDETTGIDAAWNYGVFDFAQPGYYRRLVRGEMMYWLEPFDTQALINSYIRANRSVWMQELDLTPSQRADLNEFLMWNGRDENRFYRYDYYRDNCSTRVRDALDRVLNGQLETTLRARTAGRTYRDHTQRLLADNLAEGTGTLLAMGAPADRPLDAWEEAFLPVQLMEQIRTVQVRAPDGSTRPLALAESIAYEASRAPERAAPPDRTLIYTAVGMGAGLLLLALGMLAARRPAARAAFAILAFLWALLAGVFGTVIAGLWAFTEHVVTSQNENLLHMSPLSLALAVLIPFGARARAPVARLAFVIAALSTLGFVLQLAPGIDQPNGEIIGLVLPLHLALAMGLAGPTPASSSAQDS